MDKKNSVLQIKKELPRGLIISSFLAIFFVLALLPFIAWLLEYKDTINAPLTITTKTTPVDVYAERAGKLMLLVKNNDLVEKDQPLAMIENTANYEDVKSIKAILTQENQNPILIAKVLCNSGNLKVGALKPVLVKVTKAMENYTAFIDTDQHEALIKSRVAQITLLGNRKDLFDKKGTIIKTDQSYVEKTIDRQRQLLEGGVIAIEDFEKFDRERLTNEIANLDNNYADK